jgi:biopolymer transport protein ExbD
MKRIADKRASNPDIPTASQGDIAFLLIIFFMVSTTFRQGSGLKVNLPAAEKTERILKRRNVENVWVDRTGRISVDDNMVTAASVPAIIGEKIIQNPDLVVMLQADKDVAYGYVTDVLEGLKDARALKVTFATEYKVGGGGS